MLSYVYRNVITAMSNVGYSVFDLQYHVTTQYVNITDQSDGMTSVVRRESIMDAKPGTAARGRLIEYLSEGLCTNGNTADNLVSDLFELVSK